MKYKTLDELQHSAKILNHICETLDQEQNVRVKKAISELTGGAVGGATGVGAGLAAVYFLGTTVGFSGAGIVSGLFAIGAFFGGGMVLGIGVVATTPILLSGGGQKAARWLSQGKFKTERLRLLSIAKRQETLLVGLCARDELGSLIQKYHEALSIVRTEITRLSD